MKIIHIQATAFFELLKLKDQSMWDIFAQMIDGEPKELHFLDEKEKFLFAYQLPATLEEMKKDKEIFTEKYAEKLMLNN
ncbi:MAG: hypothetical protein Q4A00_06175 [Flavobacteriaceae bacterium]|nr:hypothetical protein [Flavobacteriaceae bacterium]